VYNLGSEVVNRFHRCCEFLKSEVVIDESYRWWPKEGIDLYKLGFEAPKGQIVAF